MGFARPEYLFERSMTDLGMKAQSDNPFGCGVFYRGDGIVSEGEYWCFWHEDLFYFACCDFRVLQDAPMSMPALKYLCLRWSGVRTKRLSSFYEENKREVRGLLKKDSHVSYLEAFYLPEAYQPHLESFTEQSGMRKGFPATHWSTVNEGLPLSPLEQIQSLNASGKWPSPLLHIFREIEEYRGSKHSASLYYIGKGYELLSYLMLAGQDNPSLASRDRDPVLAVIEHIKTRYDRPIHQAELVEIAHMSASKLKDIFHRFTGKSLSDYLMAVRMEKADELLAGTSLPIEEIAPQVGYATPTGFATAFKKHAGISPRDFRKQMSFECTINPSKEFDESRKTTYIPHWW